MRTCAADGGTHSGLLPVNCFMSKELPNWFQASSMM